MRFYDHGNFEGLADIYALEDGGYVSTGSDNSFIWVIRLNEDGNVVWTNRYGDGGFDFGYSIIELDNGDLLVGGRLGERPVTVVFSALRISPDGDQIWFQTYGAGSCHAVIELKSGEIALAGRASDINAGRLVIVDSDGEVIRSRNYQHGSRPRFQGMRESGEGIVLLSAGSGQGGGIWMTRVDFDLEPEWTQDYRFEGATAVNFHGNSFVSTQDRGFAFCASWNQQGVWPGLVKTDGSGNIVWWNRYDVEREPYGADALVAIPGVGYVIAGGLYGTNLMQLDTDGEILWQATYNPPEEADHTGGNIFSIIRDQAEALVVCGQGFGDFNSSSGMVAKFEGIVWGPILLRWSPQDTLLTILTGDSVNFVVEARNQFEQELGYQFWVSDTLHAISDSIWVTFDSLGVTDVVCRVINEQSVVSIGWHVTVDDFFISSFTPDTLNLAIHRGASIDFSLDTVRYTEGDEPEYLWTKSNLSDPEQEPEVAGTEPRATIVFLQSGNYAVEGLAWRGESSDAVTWDVVVRGAIWSFAPEDLSLEVLPDSLVQFAVVPSEPENESLSIQWLVDGEVAGEDTTSFEWSFSGADLKPSYQVTVVVADTVVLEVTVRDLGVGDDEEAGQAGTHVLLSVSPNPFNSLLTIRYSAGTPPPAPPASGGDQGGVRLAIYDISGREVARLVDDVSSVNPPRLTETEGSADRRGSAEGTRALEHLSTRSLSWNASSIPAGIYLVRLQSGSEVSTKKVVLIR